MIEKTVTKLTLKEASSKKQDLAYWLSKTSEERVEAVDLLRGNFLEVQSDFRDLLALFNAHKVKYIIVGGYALAFHGVPRYTGDLDIFVHPDPKNARRILAALDDFGFGSIGLSAADFESLDKVVQLGIPPVRIDIITSLTGVSWEKAIAGRVEGRYRVFQPIISVVNSSLRIRGRQAERGTLPI